MAQDSTIAVTEYESNLAWKIAKLDGFEWMEDNYLLSNEVSFDKINVSWRLKMYPNYVDKEVSSEPFPAFEIIIDDRVANGKGRFKLNLQILKLQPGSGIGYFRRVDSKTVASVWAASPPKSKLLCYVTVGLPDPLKLPSMIVDGEFVMLLKLEYQLCHVNNRSAVLNIEEQTIDPQESADDTDYDYIDSDDEMVDDSTMFQSITADSVALKLGHKNATNKAAELSQAVLDQSRAAPVVKVLNEHIAKKIKETNEILAKVVFNVFADTIDDLICLKNLPHDEKEKLGKSLAECVNFDNFIELYIFADILNFKALKATVDEFLGDKNYRTIALSKSYKKLKLNSYPEIYQTIFMFKISP